ncbi:MAG TPA: Hsp20/alpha crystallin family protein [Usitatibacter sp.]|nr:Hsp20/alpha crystallin family protein [Usitatibacter sp.]
MPRRNDPTDWMWAQACEFIEQAERMHRRFFRLAASERAQAAVWEPPADVFEDDREVVIVVALPGVLADNVELAIEPGVLVVRAQRPLPLAHGSRHAVRQLEIPYGSFERRIRLPHPRLEAVSRELSHGCLILRLRKVD